MSAELEELYEPAQTKNWVFCKVCKQELFMSSQIGNDKSTPYWAISHAQSHIMKGNIKELVFRYRGDGVVQILFRRWGL